MGTVASLHIYDDVATDSADAAIAEVFADLQTYEAMFSTFDPDSEISLINRGGRAIADTPREISEVLDACRWLEQSSDGAFCVYRTIDGVEHLDPAGFVKGWAAERATRHLHDRGCANWYLSVGGDILTSGSPAPGEAWQIAVADPFVTNRIAATLTVSSGAVATSGTAQRGAHLWDGRDPSLAPSAFVSVTVLGPSLTWADAFATTMFAMGESSFAWIEAFDGYDAFTIRHDGTTKSTSGLLAHR